MTASDLSAIAAIAAIAVAAALIALNLIKPRPKPKFTLAPAVTNAPWPHPQVSLGQNVRDRSSGLAGIANMRVTSFGGSVQIGIQPFDDTARTFIEPWLIDVHLLEVLDDGVMHLATPVDPSLILPLGALAEDSVSKYRGALTFRSEFMNGCVHYTVSNESVLDQNGKPASAMFEAQRLKVVAPGLSTPVKPVRKPRSAAKDLAIPAKPPGGPARRAADFRA